MMMLNLADCSHPIFRATSGKRRITNQKKGNKSINFNGCEENIELLLRTIISANQLSVCGATADLCKELSEDSESSVKMKHLIIWRRWKFLLEPIPNHSNRETWCKTMSADSNKCLMTRSYPNCALTLVLRIVERGQYFFTLDTEERERMQHLCREYTMPRSEKKTRAKGWILKNTRIGPVLDIKVCRHDDRYNIEVQIPSLFQGSTVSWVRMVNGVDKYVTESMLTMKEEETASGEPITKARPRQKPTVTLTSVSLFLFLKEDG